MLTLRSRLLAALATVVAGAALVVLPGSQPAVGAGGVPQVSGARYVGDFPDPSVVRAGNTYYAYATNTSNLNLPTVKSTDLKTWAAVGDALPRAVGWARSVRIGGRTVSRTWAPDVAWVRDHFVAAYAVPVSGGSKPKRCLTLATSSSAAGPFTDSSSGPLVCPSDQGAIDPQVYVAGRTPYLLWKTEGVVGRAPTRLWSRRLDAEGTGFADGSSATELLHTELSWEGNVIENPAMIRVNGLTYLFYSANEYRAADYAVGYAVCRGPSGPCERPSTRPLLASGGGVEGPGGPSPVMGPDGRLMMAYAAWDAGRIGYPRYGRRLHTATLAIGEDGRLRVTDRG
ncbi:beta-xylosidase [Marmoricola endophyticus]|uniref:Beta-xylosidase n=1 Tax=Marmoricola endophyticus TaxID=2040280 RepID=A0A917BAW6_9ACTN|nr:glycoside hydrolase family 43 protein [Marmoricola endophyticus]GGF31810.1 beta-xylosidase [Marmoricola endophyticus]